MKIRLAIAEAAGALSTEALQDVFHRPAANFPGKIGLLIDPDLISDLRSRLKNGSVVVVGTNGKTTVTNLLADAFEAAGKSVACNRTGANLDSGLATSLMHVKEADWGIFESDELWLAKTVPHLKPTAVVLLNLFRDQLDRMGEIDHLQAAIAEALNSSPSTILIYNSDDPLCQAIANRVENDCIPFGINEDLGLAQNTVNDASMCQECDSILAYKWRQYGQLGMYECPECAFIREEPLFAIRNVKTSEQSAEFTLQTPANTTQESIPFAGTYMLYNALAIYTATDYCNIPLDSVRKAIQSFAPDNGRLQQYEIQGHSTLLNLAKNPTGFNQNLKIILNQPGPKAVAFFINDKEADGHDISWLWDIDFQQLAEAENLQVYAGGIRKNDMQVRLKYAGLESQLIDDTYDFIAKTHASMPQAQLFLIANYTALPSVKSALDDLKEHPDKLGTSPSQTVNTNTVDVPKAQIEKLTILHMYPELLNLYGDGGNVIILAERARKRGIPVEVVQVKHGEKADLEHADIVFLGGGPDREQHLASHNLIEQTDAFRNYVENDGVLLAICGGYQILGSTWLLGDESVPGLGILDIETKRAEGGSHNRLVGNIALSSNLASMPIIGYENHAGRTFLGSSCEPFGHVVNKQGNGNNDNDKADGVRYRNVIGTYLHGPLLSKNPEIADWLIQHALNRRAAKEGKESYVLTPLDDSIERAANAFMCDKLGI